MNNSKGKDINNSRDKNMNNKIQRFTLTPFNRYKDMNDSRGKYQPNGTAGTHSLPATLILVLVPGTVFPSIKWDVTLLFLQKWNVHSCRNQMTSWSDGSYREQAGAELFQAQQSFSQLPLALSQVPSSRGYLFIQLSLELEAWVSCSFGRGRGAEASYPSKKVINMA